MSSARPRRLANEVLVLEPFADHAEGQPFHLVDGVEAPHVVASGKLVDIAMQVLGAHLVIDALMRPLEHSPEGLNALRMHGTVDVFSGAMLDDGVIVEALIAGVLIRVNHGVRGGVIQDKFLEHGLRGRVNHSGLDLVLAAALNADNRRFAHRASGPRNFLAAVLVALFAAHVRLVHFDGAVEGGSDLRGPGLADAMHQMPRMFLGNAQVAVHFHTGDAFEAGRHEVHGNDPLLQWQLAGLHGRVGFDGEVFAALRAPVRHRLGVGDGAGLFRSAPGAIPPGVAPAHVFKPLDGCGFVREELDELQNG